MKWIRMGAGAMRGLAAMALTVCGSAAFAQTKPASDGPSATKSDPAVKTPAYQGTATSGTKIAAINFRAAVASTAEGKQAAAQLEQQFAGRRKELEDLNKKIADLQQKLNASSTVISDEEKNKMQLEGQKLTRQLDRRQQDFQEDLSEAQNEVVSRIGQRIVQVIGKYAPSNGFVAVLDDSSQATPVMYAATDITQEIVKLYDQTYPVKAAAVPSDSKPGVKAVSSKPPGQ
jgi:outer membrane protein